MQTANDNPEPLFCSVKDAMRHTSLGRTTVYLLIRNGTLSTRTVGRRRLIDMSSLKALAATG